MPLAPPASRTDARARPKLTVSWPACGRRHRAPCARARHRPGRRLRRPVRAADRAAGQGMPGALGDRAGQHAGGADPGAQAEGGHPVGRPASVYADGAPPAPAGLLGAGIPVLGICYGFQLMVAGFGGTVARTGVGEYGGTALDLLPAPGAADAGGAVAAGGTLLAGLPSPQQVWMSHGDTCTLAPPGFAVTARTAASPVAAVEDPRRGLYGVQFHPEVAHTPSGLEVLRRFLVAAGCRQDWTMRGIIDEQVALIAEQVGGGRAICGLSGGVDSAVAAALVQRAIGSRLSCVFVDHGLLRTGEAEQVEQDFVAATGVNLTVVDAAADFLAALAGVADPEEKRKIIGREFIRAFEQAARQIAGTAGGRGQSVNFLVQGTLYPDVVESGGGAWAANIKS